MRSFAVLGPALVLALALGCSSGSTASSGPFADPDVVGASANPDGVPYPPGPYGRSPRRGSVHGDRLPNLSFSAYRDANVAAGLQVVSFADYHDPTGKRAKLLHVMVGAYWCGYCRQLTKLMVQALPELAPLGYAPMQLLIQGATQGKAPSLLEVQSWIETHDAPFTVGIDALGKRITTVADLSQGVPWSAFVDARTMEILGVGSGVLVDFTQQAKDALAWIDAHPVDPDTGFAK
jgi:thiol-disulfide isomerase/thioredoxin